MPQRIEYPTVSGKRWEWHFVLLKEWLRTVQPGIGERKYTKWLRTRKVFERKFITFGEQLLGLERGGRDVILGEVGEELVEALDASEQAAEKAQAAALERGPGRDMPRPAPAGRGAAAGRSPAPPTARAARPAARPAAADDDDDLPEGVEPDAGGGDAAVLGPPTPENDPFMKALLERFTELNPYLSMFVLREIADGFLAPTELMRRIGMSSFQGVRPNMQQLEGWIAWMEWLGGLKKVGFRHKASDPAREIAAYLTEMPVEDLLERDEEEAEAEDEAPAAEPEDEAPAAPTPTARTPRAPAPAPDEDDRDDDDGGGEDDEDTDEFDDEGLDLPPSAEPAPDGEVYWRREPARVEPESLEAAAPAAVAVADRGDEDGDGDGDGEEDEGEDDEGDDHGLVATAAAPARARDEPAAPPPVAFTPAPAPVALTPAPAPTPTPTTPVPAPAPTPTPGRGALVAQALTWWLDEPPAPSLAQAAGIRIAPHPSGKPVGLFKLLALASLLEAGPLDDALALFRAIDAAVEGHLVDGAPLEQVLEAAWAHGASPALEQRLVHLPRYRRALLALPFKALSPAQEARALARTLRDAVTGPTLGAGLALVVRELARNGWRLSGAEAVDWLPFPGV